MPKIHCAAPEQASLLDGSSAGELFPELAGPGLQQLIELELAAFLDADWHERTEEQLGHRNGYSPRTLTTQVGDLALQIPKLRAGSFISLILEPRSRIDQALQQLNREQPGFYGGSLRTLQRRMAKWRVAHAEQVVGKSRWKRSEVRIAASSNTNEGTTAVALI